MRTRVCLPKVLTLWPAAREKRARLLLEFVRAHGAVHPREVDSYFSHGTVKNYWGGSSNATTHLLAAMHYRGMLRVARREGGVRIYAAQRHGAEPADTAERLARIDALVDVAVRIYAPLPGPCLSDLVRRLRFAVPQWRSELKNALQRVKQRLSHARVGGVDWYWPAEEDVARFASPGTVRLLTPFDPVVWTATASNCCGAGRTVSRLIRRRLNASSAITQCRCFGATASLVGRISPWRRGDLSLSLAMSSRARRMIARSSVSSRQSWIA